MENALQAMASFATNWQECNIASFALDGPIKLPPKYYKQLIKILSRGATGFVLTPCLPDESAQAPDPPGPQYYWCLRASGEGTILAHMQQEEENQKRNDEQSCVDMLLNYVSEPGHLPHPSW